MVHRRKVCNAQSNVVLLYPRSFPLLPQASKQRRPVPSKRRCSQRSRTEQPTSNAEGIKTAVRRKKRAKDGKVNAATKRCSHHSCKRPPTFNVEGSKTAAYCKQHAEDGMTYIRRTLCSHDSCMKQPTFNTEGNKLSLIHISEPTRQAESRMPSSA